MEPWAAPAGIVCEEERRLWFLRSSCCCRGENNCVRFQELRVFPGGGSGWLLWKPWRDWVRQVSMGFSNMETVGDLDKDNFGRWWAQRSDCLALKVDERWKSGCGKDKTTSYSDMGLLWFYLSLILFRKNPWANLTASKGASKTFW